MDNDVYGHVNNVTYYSYFDTVANHFLIREGGLDIERSDVIGLVVESKCTLPRAARTRNSSAEACASTSSGSAPWSMASASSPSTKTKPRRTAILVHVFVDRATRSPVAIPERILAAFESLLEAAEQMRSRVRGGRYSFVARKLMVLATSGLRASCSG